MGILNIPVRYYRDFPPHYDYAYEILSLKSEETAFLLVDVDGGSNSITEKFIVPALTAAREIGLKVAYVHNDLRLVADPGNIVFEIWGKTKGMKPESWRRNQDFKPTYIPAVAPKENEPNFPKWAWSGFHHTMLDQHLRSWGIKTLIAVGFNQRACLHYTCVDAVYRNYRLILLRDGTRAAEQPDTVNEELEEGGWIGKITLRNFEHLIGYTSTSAEFIGACQAIL